MAAAFTVPAHTTAPIRVPALAWALVLLGTLALYVMLQENGALLHHSWMVAHELFHDGRHALGVPCH
ncbi:MAG: hypothetical protein JWM89_1290 [Acidimicrobiales bacterium]|nr:hypothetical protein [Acidimicrobiales bacterium]